MAAQCDVVSLDEKTHILQRYNARFEVRFFGMVYCNGIQLLSMYVLAQKCSGTFLVLFWLSAKSIPGPHYMNGLKKCQPFNGHLINYV